MLTLKIKVQTMRCEYPNKRAILAKFWRSFGEGVGSIVSLQGGYIRLPLGSARTDAEQLRSDWEAVGRELRSAYKTAIDTHTNSSNYGETNERAE